MIIIRGGIASVASGERPPALTRAVLSGTAQVGPRSGGHRSALGFGRLMAGLMLAGAAAGFVYGFIRSVWTYETICQSSSLVSSFLTAGIFGFVRPFQAL